MDRSEEVNGSKKVAHVPQIVERLFECVKTLEQLFPGRRFTLDGHLVGSLGEVLAAHHYNLRLLKGSEPVHDASVPDGRRVQVKATQRRTIGLRALPDHLLVVRLHQNGTIDEVFNGPGRIAWDAAGPMQKNGQRSIGLGCLRKLMADVKENERLPALGDARDVQGRSAHPWTTRPHNAL